MIFRRNALRILDIMIIQGFDGGAGFGSLGACATDHIDPFEEKVPEQVRGFFDPVSDLD